MYIIRNNWSPEVVIMNISIALFTKEGIYTV